MRNVLDDISLQSFGSRAIATAELGTAFRIVIDGLRSRGLPLQLSKCCLTRDTELACAVGHNLEQVGLKRKMHERLLGLEYRALIHI